MDKIIQGCFIARLYRVFVRAFPESFLGKLVAFFKLYWHESVTGRAVSSVFCRPSSIPHSKTYAMLQKTNDRLGNLGKRLCPICQSSLTVRAVSAFWSSKAVEHSVVLSFLKNLGMKRFLIAVFALYLPLDVAIRDVLQIAVVSSVWDEAFMIFCVGYIIYRICKSDKSVSPRISPVDTPLIFFISISVLLVAVVSPKMSTAISGFRAVCQFMLWFFVLTRLIEDDKDFKTLYFTVCGMACVLAFHGIYQYITKAPIPSNWVAQAEVGVRTRVYSIFGSPNVMGAFLIMTAPMLAACAYYAKKRSLKILMWALTGVLCLATLFTFSRGAWFGLTVAVIIFAILVDIRLLFVAAAGILGVILLVPEIANRIAFLFTPDFADANARGGRAGRWDIGISLWEQNKIFGFGLGRYGGAIAMQTQDESNLLYYYMDNYYLKTLTEMGLLGLVSYVWLLLRNFVSSCKSILRTKKDRMSYLSCGIVSGQIGVLTHSFFENIFEVPYMNAYFWGLSAAVIYLGFLRKNKNGSCDAN